MHMYAHCTDCSTYFFQNGKTPFELSVQNGHGRVVCYFYKELHMETSHFDEVYFLLM